MENTEGISPPLVSVIMPVFNAALFLRQAIASVQAQSKSNWELLVVDDGSTDHSLLILAGMAATDPRIQLLTTGGNLGAGAARNHALEAARGRYIAFLDADDIWHPEKLRLQLEAMRQAGLPFSCTAYQRHLLKTGENFLIGVPAYASRAALLKTNTVACSTVIFDRRYFGSRKMSSVRRRQDFLLWLDLLLDTPSVLGVSLVLMTYRQHDTQLSASKIMAAKDTWKMYRQSLGLSRTQASWYFSNYALRGLLRRHAPTLARTLGWLHSARTPESSSP